MSKVNMAFPPTTKIKDSKADLCLMCKFEVPTCMANKIEYGNGEGHDNVIECDCYEPKKEVSNA